MPSREIFEFLGYSGMFFLILALTVLAARVMARLMASHIRKTSEALHVDPTHYTFLKHLVSAAIYVTGIGIAVYVIPVFRHVSVSLFAGSGILAVIIGFASQHALSNIVSGIFITIFKPMRIGDRITMPGKDIRGIVEDITLRHTVIRTFENKRVLVPNALMSTEIIENANLVDDRICRLVDMGISYDSDIDRAMAIMRDEAMKHPLYLDNRTPEQISAGDPAVWVRLVDFADSAVNLRAWVWSRDQACAFQMGCDLNKAIKEAFDREGIEIPYPHRTVVHKTPSASRPEKAIGA